MSRVSRRKLLGAGGLGAAVLGGAGLWRGTGYAQGPGGDYPDGHGHLPGDLEALGVVRAGYGHGPAPPRDLDAALVEALTHPPPPSTGPVEVDLPVHARRWPVAEGATLSAWTYGERVPGPVLRATEGQPLRINLANHTDLPHNLHLHGGHDPQMDGWEPIPAGESFTYDVTAAPFGLHPYHCHTHPLAEHVRRGLYGALIVDPPGGRPPAVEVVLVLGGFDLTGDGRNDLYAFNGVCGLYDRHPIRVPTGELVRAYVVNMVEADPVASFHLHAQTFDVYRSGTSLEPDEHTDQVTLAQGDRAIVEFRLPIRGRYMFHPHQHHMVERGAVGWFTAI